MRLVGFALVGVLLSAGCALQTGDPGADEAQRPQELVTEPGGGEATVLHPSTATGNVTSPQGASTGAKASRGATATGTEGAGGVPTGPKDNPNPSPWGGGDVFGNGDFGTGNGK